MIGRAIGLGMLRSARRGAAADLNWSHREFASGGDEEFRPSRIPQHYGPGKLVGKTALITGCTRFGFLRHLTFIVEYANAEFCEGSWGCCREVVVSSCFLALSALLTFLYLILLRK